MYCGNRGIKSGNKCIPIPLFAEVIKALALFGVVLLFASCASQSAGTGGVSSSDVTASQSTSSVVQDASPSESVVSSSEAATSSALSSTSSSTELNESLSPEQAAIKSLDGWWAGAYHRPGYYGAYGNVHDSVVDWYYYNPDTDAVEYSNTVDIVRADRFDENGAKGWRFFPSTAADEAFAYYQVEGDEDNLPIYMTANGYGNIDPNNYNTGSPERFGITRITDPSALDGDGMHTQAGFNQAKALAEERGAAKASADASMSSSSSSTSFDRAKAEADARAAAEAAGKQILTGIVYIQDQATRANELNTGLPSPGTNPVYAFLVLSGPMTVTAKNADGATARQEPYRTHDGITSVLLGSDGGYDAGLAPWQQYEGQQITIACTQDEMSYFSDTLGALFNVRAMSAEVIAPITEEMVKAQEVAQKAAGSPDAYVLAESNTREYSRGELEALDNFTLFLARNEIYARHGRGFKKQELRDHFANKSWYRESVSPESFDEGILSEVEKANANLMLEIESSRNSPYLN